MFIRFRYAIHIIIAIIRPTNIPSGVNKFLRPSLAFLKKFVMFPVNERKTIPKPMVANSLQFSVIHSQILIKGDHPFHTTVIMTIKAMT